MMAKNKNRLLLIGILLFAILAYRFAFSKTIETRQKVITLEKEGMEFKDLAKLSSNLAGKEKYLDSILEKNNLKNTSVQNSLLDFLNQESSSRSIKITEFDKPHSSLRDGINVISYQFTLTGDYKEMEQILYKLEQETGYGKVSHVSFEKKRDFRKRRDFLYARVIVENYDSN